MIFECPHCKETIDSAEKKCRFCSALIDPGVAEKAAKTLAKVNQACSDASFMRTAAIALLALFGMMFVPLLSWYGTWGCLILFVAVLVMVVRWWLRFWRIETDDDDFVRARRTVAVISALLFFPVIRFVSVVAIALFGLGAQ
jgi:Ca2+/Na+ antiporter